MNLLFLAKKFCERGGGAPESIRLAAKLLGANGISCDVLDGTRFYRDVQTMTALPDAEGGAAEHLPDVLPNYSWVICAGPWQSPLLLLRALLLTRSFSRFIYLPRGGLCEIEFVYFRNIKKFPYFAFIEIVWILLARKILFSSKLEHAKSVFPVRQLRNKVCIAPDFFLPSWSSSVRNLRKPAGEVGEIVISFLAAIHPRKGLDEFIRGLDVWCRSQPNPPRVKLRVGGGVKKHCVGYVRKIEKFVQQSNLDGLVEFCGPVAHQDREKFYRDTDIFVATSRFESFGLTVLEALHSGCVTLTGKRLGVLEYVADNPDLVVCNGLSEKEIADGLMRAIERLSVHAPENKNAKSVEKINELALLQWQELLGAGHQS